MTDRESGKEGAGEWRLLETGEQQSRLAIICGKHPPPHTQTLRTKLPVLKMDKWMHAVSPTASGPPEVRTGIM